MKNIDSAFYKPIIVIFCVYTILLTGCKSLETRIISRDIKKEIEHDDFFKNQFTGFSLFNPSTGSFISQINGDKYFTPASNTKILTTLAVLETFGDSIPSFAYSKKNDSLILLPLADPTFLHPKYNSDPLINKISQHPYIEFLQTATKIQKYGPGWAWDDYTYDFQPERSFFPIYGNVLSISYDSTIHIAPSFFNSYVNIINDDQTRTSLTRDESINIFNTNLGKDSTAFFRSVPFKTSSELERALINDIFIQASFSPYSEEQFTDTLYSQRTMNVLAHMMKASDNFLAEQLLIQAGIMNNEWDVDVYRNKLLKKWSAFLSGSPQWVDGSGLSRYNMISPDNLVGILSQIYQTISFEEVKSIFPVGGESGTIKDYYTSTTPYVIAKTGTLMNNHCLSGFLITKSGKTLIFSFMNNHYLSSSLEAKKAMEKLLIKIRDSY